MKAIFKVLFWVENTKRFMQESERHTMAVRTIVRNLLLVFMALVFSISLASTPWASEEKRIENHENLDKRWLPWIGSWRLVSNTINTIGTPLKEEYLLTIRPDEAGTFVIMESTRDKTVMFEEKIAADGLRRSLDKDECTGWYVYSWSDTGNRLLFNGESSCADNLSQKISGISIIDTVGDYVDIKLLKSGDEKAVTIRRYRKVDNDIVDPAPSILSKAFNARITTGNAFSIDEVIELSGKVEPELLETALVEMNKPFPVNSKQLVRLSDANVPSQIVDLVVALSFPKKFAVEKATLSWVETELEFTAPYYHWPMCPWYWTSSAYWHYGYRYYGWDWYLQYGWYYPYGYRYDTYTGRPDSDTSGRLVSGRGYTRVNPVNSDTRKRYAQPRNAQASQITKNPASMRSGAGGSSSVAIQGGSGTAVTGSGYSAPSASPSGYSGGGTGEAQPR